MKRFTDAGARAIADENWYAALSLALIIPDIAGSIEQPGPGKSQKRYVGWCKKWIEPEFTHVVGGDMRHVFISAEDLYQMRCSVIHSGTSDIDEPKRDQVDRFEFFSAGPHLNFVQGMVVNGVAQPRYLQLRVDKFAEVVFKAADAWDEAVADDDAVQAEKAKLLVVHPSGTAIGGILWG